VDRWEGGRLLLEPVPQGQGGLNVVAVVGQQPVTGSLAALDRLVVADHRLVAAWLVHVPREAAQRGGDLQLDRVAGDEVTPEHLQQVHPLVGGDEVLDLVEHPDHGSTAAHLGVLVGLVVAVGPEREPGVGDLLPQP
jgi:hypothetical protein